MYTVCVCCRVADLEGEGAAIGDHVILEPLAFSGQVIRRLSSWCIAVPAIAVKANLKALEVLRMRLCYLSDSTECSLYFTA